MQVEPDSQPLRQGESRVMSKGGEPRGGHTLARHQIGGVSVRLSFGNLDRMPVCRKCGRVICDHSDAEFTGVIPS